VTAVDAVDARAAAGTALVLFADQEPWEAFVQFAAALRRRGIRVERLTAADRSAVRRVNDLLQRPVYHRIRPELRFDPAGGLPAAGVPADLPAGVAACEAVDVVAAALSGAPGVPPRAADPAAEQLLFDKLAITRFAAARGIAVPRSWAAEDPAPVPPPFLVKPRLGSGGQGIEVLPDEVAVARLRRTAPPARLMCQERAPGELLHVGGVARDGVVLQAACYRAVGSPFAAFGPSAEVLTVDDAAASDATATLLGSLRYTGAFCLDFVRDADGRPLLIDVNARVFGSWAALQAAGLDLVGAYLFAWGLSDEPPTGSLPAGRRLLVLPPDTAAGGRGALAAHLAGIGRATGLLGPRWAASTTARVLSAALVRAARRMSGRELPR
jgi:hypothetical protein